MGCFNEAVQPLAEAVDLGKQIFALLVREDPYSLLKNTFFEAPLENVMYDWPGFAVTPFERLNAAIPSHALPFFFVLRRGLVSRGLLTPIYSCHALF